jgi:hypothetical protein
VWRRLDPADNRLSVSRLQSNPNKAAQVAQTTGFGRLAASVLSTLVF